MEPMESNQGFELESVVLEFEKCAKTETAGFKHHQRTRLKPAMPSVLGSFTCVPAAIPFEWDHSLVINSTTN
jgi:hypothetical protein